MFTYSRFVGRKPIVTAQPPPVTPQVFIPTSYDDPRFATNTPGSTAAVSTNATITNKTWDDSPLYNTPPDYDSLPPFFWSPNGGTTLNISKSRWKWREGFRVDAGNTNVTLNMSECYIECVGRDMTAFGAPRIDHTDCLQVYSPGGSGTLNISKTTFRTYTDQEAVAAHGAGWYGGAGLLYGDDFQGQINLTDVVFYGGRTGIEVYSTVGPVTVSFENVYFVPSAQPWSGGQNIILTAENGTTLTIAKWVNVRAATIAADGSVVPGALIAEPTGTGIVNTSGGSSDDPGTFNVQTGTFTVEWDAVPNGAAIDVVNGVSNGVPSAFSSFACSLRFNSTGAIDSRNGGAYAAANARTYSSGVSYHCKITADIAAKTYDAWVTPSGGAQVQIASDYAFRTEQNAVAQLNYLGKLATTGDTVMSNMIGPAAEALAPVVTAATIQLNTTTGAGWSAGKIVGTVTASRSPTSFAFAGGTNSSGYFAISSVGVITLTSTGITALGGTTGNINLSVTATNGSGTSAAATITIVRSLAASIPLSYTDNRFATNTQETTYNGFSPELTTSRTFTNKDWDYRPTLSYGDEYIRWNGNTTTVTQTKCRCYAREGLRMNGTNDTLNASECFFLVIGNDPEDHADGLQGACANSTVNWTNICVRCYADAEAKALLGSQAVGSDGFRWTDDPTGTVNFTNVVIMGGGRGVSIVADSPTITINWENVYFVELNNGFQPESHYMYRLGSNTDGNFVVGKWINVCRATIDNNGILVPGAALPSPGNRSGNGNYDDYK